MTTQMAVLAAPTGLTLTAKLFTIAAPDMVYKTAGSVTYRTNATAQAVAAFTDVAAGDYTIIYFSGTRPVAIGYRTFAGTDGETAIETPPTVVLDSDVGTQIDNIENAAGWLLAVAAGACANPQTATETYDITAFGINFRVAMAGLDSTGTRTAPTLSNP